jgi:ribonuclease P protein component
LKRRFANRSGGAGRESPVPVWQWGSPHRAPPQYLRSGRESLKFVTKNETTISTVENPPETPARIFEPQLDQIRPGNPGQSPPRRPQAFDSGVIFPATVMAAAPSPRLRLPRSNRLKQKRDFERARKQGQRVVSGCLIANWLPLSPGAPARLGVVTSRRLGNAVVRARARRLLRESFRLHQHELSHPVDLVLIARQSIVGKSFQGVERDFLKALRQSGVVTGVA